MSSTTLPVIVPHFLPTRQQSEPFNLHPSPELFHLGQIGIPEGQLDHDPGGDVPLQKDAHGIGEPEGMQRRIQRVGREDDVAFPQRDLVVIGREMRPVQHTGTDRSAAISGVGEDMPVAGKIGLQVGDNGREVCQVDVDRGEKSGGRDPHESRAGAELQHPSATNRR